MKTNCILQLSLSALALSGALACAGDVTSGSDDDPFAQSSVPGSMVQPGGSVVAPGLVTPGMAPIDPVTGFPTEPGEPGAVAPGTPDPTMPMVPGTAQPPTTPVSGEPLDPTSDPALVNPVPPQSAGPLVVRRLNPTEYSNTLFDLLQDDSSPGAALPDEANHETGYAVTESASTVTVQHFMDTAERLVQSNAISIPCDGSGGEEACATEFIDDFGRRAFRRAVKSSERQNLLVLFDRARELGFTVEESLRHVASAMLQSSGFLYLWEIDDSRPQLENGVLPLTQHQLASRLSYLITGSTPDDELSALADSSSLTTPEQLRAQAERLLGTNPERIEQALGEFHRQWLRIENLEDLVKDPTVYPDFTDTLRDALAPELRRFSYEVIVNGEGTTRELLTSTRTYASGEAAAIYGASASGAGLAEVTVDPAERAGIMTQLAFLATNATTTGSNPPRRGKVLWEQLLCGNVPPPPADVPAVEPAGATTTTRQRFEAHSENPCASACHGILDPAGFAFEQYDGMGAYRSEENGFPVDASGVLRTPAGATLEFQNAVELMGQLSDSFEVDRCVATQWFRFMLNRPETDADLGSLEVAYRASGAGPAADFSVREFLLQMVQTTAFRYRAPGAGEAM